MIPKVPQSETDVEATRRHRQLSIMRGRVFENERYLVIVGERFYPNVHVMQGSEVLEELDHLLGQGKTQRQGQTLAIIPIPGAHITVL